jgi:glutamyl-tRNA reductase
MNKLDGIFVYDIDDLKQVSDTHMEERKGQAIDAETLIAGEVERFHQRQRTVNVAPAIVALQQRAEEIRQAELHRIQSRLASLTPEQTAAVEALTRGLVNKFLHPPMQALKQAARENDTIRLEAVCDEWHVSPNPPPAPEDSASRQAEQQQADRPSETKTPETRSPVEASR